MRSPLSSFFGAGLFRKQDSSGEFTVAKNKNKNMFRAGFGENENQQMEHVHVQQLLGDIFELK